MNEGIPERAVRETRDLLAKYNSPMYGLSCQYVNPDFLNSSRMAELLGRVRVDAITSEDGLIAIAKGEKCAIDPAIPNGLHTLIITELNVPKRITQYVNQARIVRGDYTLLVSAISNPTTNPDIPV